MTAALTPPAWAARRFAPSPPLRTDGLIPFDQAIAYARGCCEMMCSPETIDLLARAAADGATLDALTARWHAELLEQCGLESAFAMSAFRSDTDPSRFDFAPSPAAHAAGDATADVAERLVPGIPEAMLWRALEHEPHAMLSRAIAGIRGRTLIVNLPGRPKAVRENLAVLMPVLRHALEQVSGGGAAAARI